MTTRMTRAEARRYVRKMVAEQLSSDISNGSNWLYGDQCGDDEPTFDEATIVRVHDAVRDMIRSMQAERRRRV